MKKLASVVALLGSSATLVCCVIPVLFVVLGFGATFAGIIGAFPQLTWLSENKPVVFGVAAVLLGISGYFQWRNRYTACPIDPKLAEGCRTARGWSFWVFIVSITLYLIGFAFVFGAPLLLA